MRLWSTITYSENCAGDQIKPCKTVVCKFYKDNLFHRLMNYLKYSSDAICVILFKLKYSTASNFDSSCVLGITSYLGKQTLFTSKFSG